MPLHEYFNPTYPQTLPDGAIGETMDRRGTFGSTIAPVAGQLRIFALDRSLTAGTTVSSITFLAGTTVPGTVIHCWAALYDANRVLLGQSVNITTTDWAISTWKTFPLAAPVVIPATGLIYVGFMQSGATMNNLIASTVNSNIMARSPSLTGACDTGLTTTAPNPAQAPSVSSVMAYAYVS